MLSSLGWVHRQGWPTWSCGTPPVAPGLRDAIGHHEGSISWSRTHKSSERAFFLVPWAPELDGPGSSSGAARHCVASGKSFNLSVSPIPHQSEECG